MNCVSVKDGPIDGATTADGGGGSGGDGSGGDATAGTSSSDATKSLKTVS